MSVAKCLLLFLHLHALWVGVDAKRTSRCEAALQATCSTHVAGAGSPVRQSSCAACTELHQRKLKVAGCDNDVIQRYCASDAPVDNRTHCATDFCTWWHATGEIVGDRPVADGAVRQSSEYLVLVRAAEGNEMTQYYPSFVYESIPRNGNGKIFSPTDAPHSNTWRGPPQGDGITIEPQLGVSMAWSQFEHAVDVDVKVIRRDGKSVGSAIVRPTNLALSCANTPDGRGVVVRVPAPSTSSHGLQFSVEFDSDTHTYYSDGKKYVNSSGNVVGKEPTHALLIFASPFIPVESLPPTGLARLTMRPGAINARDVQEAPEVLHFPAGVYWVEPRGQNRLLLNQKTRWVHFDGGAYVKAAIEYTTSATKFWATGHGVLSGEHYVYQANPMRNWTSVKSDGDSLRMWRHNHIVGNQQWTLRGPTVVAPPFNSMDFFGATDSSPVMISDYKQVGAFFFQTDGPEMYPGSMVRDVFYHVNDDGLKLYHSNVSVRNATLWKILNDPVIQMGWTARDLHTIHVAGVQVIHSRYCTVPNDAVPQAIIGASKGVEISATKMISAELFDIVCEGPCPALMHITPLQNFNLTITNVAFPDGLQTNTVGLGRSEVWAAPGVHMRLHVSNWTVRDEKVTMRNFQSDKLGQFDIAAQYWGEWIIT